MHVSSAAIFSKKGVENRLLVVAVSTLRVLSIFFLDCLLHSAHGTKLLSTAAARILADRWFYRYMSKTQLISVFLFGTLLLSQEQNNDKIFHVQSFIIESMRYVSAGIYQISK